MCFVFFQVQIFVELTQHLFKLKNVIILVLYHLPCDHSHRYTWQGGLRGPW